MVDDVADSGVSQVAFCQIFAACAGNRHWHWAMGNGQSVWQPVLSLFRSSRLLFNEFRKFLWQHRTHAKGAEFSEFCDCHCHCNLSPHTRCANNCLNSTNAMICNWQQQKKKREGNKLNESPSPSARSTCERLSRRMLRNPKHILSSHCLEGIICEAFDQQCPDSI